jgi:NitT/TauT family transport system substrate-binding protein
VKSHFPHLPSAFLGLARIPRALAALSAGALAWVLCTAAVFGAAAEAGADPHPGTSAPRAETELRLGYFANVTHATAVFGVERGLFEAALGADVELRTFTFNAGPSAIEALLSGALDASYIGPNPAINAYVKSKGQALRVIAGATSGGAFLVVDPSIETAQQLRGKRIATPQLGNTQDVALRAWLRAQGLRVELTGASDVQVVPQENAQTLEQFRGKHIQGAWVPEPWATRLLLEGGGKVLVDERDLWPDGRYVTTHLIVTTEYLREQPAAVRALLRGHLRAQQALLDDPAQGRDVVNAGIARITGKRIAAETIEGAWRNLLFTHDPIADSLVKSGRDAESIGLLELRGMDLYGIYELGPLNEVLAETKQAPIAIGARK